MQKQIIYTVLIACIAIISAIISIIVINLFGYLTSGIIQFSWIAFLLLAAGTGLLIFACITGRRNE